MSKLRFDAFLSYNKKDSAAVKELAIRLRDTELECWFDEWNLIPGQSITKQIDEAIHQSKTYVVFVGPNDAGPWQSEEAESVIRAIITSEASERSALLVYLPGARPSECRLPDFLKTRLWVTFCESVDDPKAFHCLKCGILGIEPGISEHADQLKGICPYLGLNTFQESDSRLFFGRRTLVDRLMEHFRENFAHPTERRFLALIGASGGGKSSLAYAGLLPRIRGGELPGSDHWPIVICKPGNDPWQNLMIALCSNSQLRESVSASQTLAGGDAETLNVISRLALHGRSDDQRVYVLIDQFEEVFTSCDDQASSTRFVANLVNAVQAANSRTLVTITLRADYYGQCLANHYLRELVAQMQIPVGPMTREELREAIVRPAQLSNCDFEPGLVEMLLEDMESRPGALPFLEHALRMLWEAERVGGHLTLDAYRRIGGLEGAVDQYARDFFDKRLTDSERQQCKQLLLQLVHPGEGIDTKKRVLLASLGELLAPQQLINRLIAARLITTDSTSISGPASIELSHEALIAGWKQLKEWINQARDQMRALERLNEAAAQWDSNGQLPDDLARGNLLNQGNELMKSHQLEVPPQTEEFIRRSTAQVKSELEKDQLKKEIETKKQAEFEATQRVNRQLTRRLTLALVFSLVAFLAVVVAAIEWRKSSQAGYLAGQNQKKAEEALKAVIKATALTKEAELEADKQRQVAVRAKENEAAQRKNAAGALKDALQQAETQGELDRSFQIRDTTPEPFRWVCHIEYTAANLNQMRATGVLVGPRHVLTAGYVVYDPSNGNKFTKRAQIYAGRSGDSKLAEAEAIEFKSTVGWMERHDPAFCYGLMVLNRNIGDDLGFATLQYSSDEELTKMTLCVLGYPVHLKSAPIMSPLLVASPVHLNEARPNELTYQAATDFGMGVSVRPTPSCHVPYSGRVLFPFPVGGRTNVWSIASQSCQRGILAFASGSTELIGRVDPRLLSDSKVVRGLVSLLAT